jgi:hypothetical protein
MTDRTKAKQEDAYKTCLFCVHARWKHYCYNFMPLEFGYCARRFEPSENCKGYREVSPGVKCIIRQQHSKFAKV